MAEPTTDPRAAQIAAVRDVMGWGEQPDAWNEAKVADLAADLVDAVHAAGRDGQGEAICHRCGGPNIIWSAPSPLWNAVMRGGSIMGTELHGGIVCPPCFAQLAEQAGVTGCRWRFWAEDVRVELETVTPSGRVWDEQAWLWREPGDVQRDEDQGEARGYARAVAALRDDSRYGTWWSAREYRPEDRYWTTAPRNHLADYLEAVGPDGTPAPVSLGGQPHDATGCRLGGQPHLGPCDGNSQSTVDRSPFDDLFTEKLAAAIRASDEFHATLIDPPGALQAFLKARFDRGFEAGERAGYARARQEIAAEEDTD